MLTDDLLGLLLPVKVEAGAHLEAAHFQLFLGDDFGEFLGHPAGEERCCAVEVFRCGRFEIERRVFCCRGRGAGDEALLTHPLQHDRALLSGQIRIHQGRVNRRCRRQTGDQSGFRQRELVWGLGEIVPGGIRDAIGAGSEVHKVEVLLKDLLLAQLTLQLHGQGGFLELSDDGAVLAEKNGASQLLGDGAGSFPHRTLPDIGDNGPGDAPAIDAVMLKEAAVFSGDEGLLHQQGHGARLQLVAGGWSQFLDDAPPRGQQGDRSRAVEVGDAAGIRQSRVDQLGQRSCSESGTDAHTRCSSSDEGPMQTGAVHIS